jgi:hypothetical protein
MQDQGSELSAKFVRGLGSSSTVRRMRRLQPRSGVGIVARRAEPLANSAIFPLQANMISLRSEQPTLPRSHAGRQRQFNAYKHAIEDTNKKAL